MERAEWLSQMRAQAEALYDHLSPGYWINFGQYANETHCQYLQKFLARLASGSAILSAGCGAGRYDGMLLDACTASRTGPLLNAAGHIVMGIDQSAGMLARARETFPQERYPQARYEKLGLQEMAFHEAFDGAICIDAMEHVCPEDWPGIVSRFREALKPGGLLYITVEIEGASELEAAYARARARGLPVVFGEVVDEVEIAYDQARALGVSILPGDLADRSVYHYYPALEQVRAWFEQAGLEIVEEGTGNGYEHFIGRRK